MRKILVVYYSSYGHIEVMAYAQAEGAAKVPGTEVVVKRVAELAPPDVCKNAGFKLDQAAPIATPEELEQYDAVIFRHAHALRQHGRADAQLPRPDRWAVGP